jgi:hypothetical protein
VEATQTRPACPPSHSHPPTVAHAHTGDIFPHGVTGPRRNRSWVMRQLAPRILPAGTNPGPQGICPLLFLQLASLPCAPPSRNQAGGSLAAHLRWGGDSAGEAERKEGGSQAARGLGVTMVASKFSCGVGAASLSPKLLRREAAYGLLTEQLPGGRRRKEAWRAKHQSAWHRAARPGCLSSPC